MDNSVSPNSPASQLNPNAQIFVHIEGILSFLSLIPGILCLTLPRRSSVHEFFYFFFYTMFLTLYGMSLIRDILLNGARDFFVIRTYGSFTRLIFVLFVLICSGSNFLICAHLLLVCFSKIVKYLTCLMTTDKSSSGIMKKITGMTISSAFEIARASLEVLFLFTKLFAVIGHFGFRSIAMFLVTLYLVSYDTMNEDGMRRLKTAASAMLLDVESLGKRPFSNCARWLLDSGESISVFLRRIFPANDIKVHFS